MTTTLETLPQRFWAKVQRGRRDQCWLWTGAQNSKGYGCIGTSGDMVELAARISWEMEHGRPPGSDEFVRHRCGDPLCVNPHHLRITRKRPRGVTRGEQNHKAKLTENDVKRIKRALADGQTQASLARAHGVSSYTIRDIARGNTWKDVQP